ncbi:DUF4962 domain-containing protein [bacterium]|nr:DUF4962 domain-containing protein [bacterium]
MRAYLLPLLMLGAAHLAHAETLISLDFEQSTDVKAYPVLSFSGSVTGEVVPGGPDGKGQCLKFTNAKPDKYCQASIKLDRPMVKDLAISFDHREVIEEGKKPNYLGIIFDGPGSSQWFSSDKFTDQWRHVEVSPADLESPTKTTLTLETLLSRVNLYGRADNETQAIMTVWLDNIRIHTDPRPAQLSDRVRTSYTAAPFFHWARNMGPVRLEYSPDPAFPAAQTTTVETSRNWVVPDKALAPGDWYWRVHRDSPLASSVTPAEKIVIPAEAHRYIGPPIPFAELNRRGYPRLIGGGLAPEAERASLISQARSSYRQGIPDDPPAYAPGNPDWPTWIDWYGKVHGGITSRTGGRLQQMAELYVRTRDPQVRDWLKEMALKAATWDPLGGSSIKGGDIGFQHLLRGLNWAYDALHDDLTDEERGKLRGVLIRRAELFSNYLNPFRVGGREYNNHAWLCALALGESGLLLTGEYEPATNWAQYAYDLYCGLFLCGLGYQGDNNEGIGYWGYGLSFVIKYADMMKQVCNIDLFQHPWLYQTGRFPMYTCPPGAWAVSFADTAKPNHSVFGPAMTSQVRELALRTKDPYALWYAGGTAAEAGFEPKPPLDLPQSIFYRFIGWGVFNTSLLSGADGVTVAMHSGPFWAGHQHEDQNAFVIHAYGEKLAIDSGYYDWYGSPHFTNYSTLTRAHNAILVNGQDQKSRRPGCDGVVREWFDSPAFGAMLGDASDPDLYEGALKRWDRRILFIKPGFVIVHDVLGASQGPAQYDWLLHTVAPIETDAKSQSFSFTSGQAGLSGRFIAPTDVDLKVVAGYPVEPVDGYSTRPVPPEKYSHEWTLWATPREKRQAEDFLAVMQVREAGEAAAKLEPLAVRNGLGGRITAGKETTEVLVRAREAQGPMASTGVTANAAAAVVTVAAQGRPVQAFCGGGTLLKSAGISLVEADQPVDFAWVDNTLGEIITLRADKPARLLTMLNLRGEPDLTRAPGVKIRPVKGLWELQVPAGEHQIIWPAATTKAARPAGVKLTHYPLPVGTEATHYWWGVWEAPAQGHYEMSLRSVTPPTSLTLDGKPVGLSGGTRRWLQAGRHAVLLSGPDVAPDLRLTPLPTELLPATMLPVEYAPPAGALVIEAEKPASEGQVKGQVMEKVGASGKLAHCVWDTEGQWATWECTVPREGDYRLLVRGCSEQPEVLRSLQVDQVLYDLRLSGTGGWSRTTSDWRYFALPAKLHLKPGAHTLRLEALSGSMNLDCFVLEPQ